MNDTRNEDKAIADAIARGEATPLTRYRVTLICNCANDATFGYGPTIADATARAQRAMRQHGRGARAVEVIVEHAVEHAGGGSHYEEIEP